MQCALCCNVCNKRRIKNKCNIDEVAKKYNTEVIAKLPIDQSLALCTDTGSMELFVGDYFENAADVIEAKTK